MRIIGLLILLVQIALCVSSPVLSAKMSFAPNSQDPIDVEIPVESQSESDDAAANDSLDDNDILAVNFSIVGFEFQSICSMLEVFNFVKLHANYIPDLPLKPPRV